MPKVILLAPTSPGVGLNTVAQGLVRAMEREGINTKFFKPIDYISIKEAEKYIARNKRDELLEKIVEIYSKISEDASVIIVQGLAALSDHPHIEDLNADIAKALSAKIIIVTIPANRSPEEIKEQIDLTVDNFGGVKKSNFIGYIINKIGAPTDEYGNVRLDLSYLYQEISPEKLANTKKEFNFYNGASKLLGLIPWQMHLSAPRVIDIAKFINAHIIAKGEEMRRVEKITILARGVSNVISSLKANTLIITPKDRDDIITAVALAELSGIKMSGLLLTGDYELSAKTLKLCEQAIENGLPILAIDSDTFRTALKLYNLNIEVPSDDFERVEASVNFVADHIDSSFVKQLSELQEEKHLSPAAFRYSLISKAQIANKLIVLPEGEEIRTIEAASICVERGIARCLLLGDEKRILETAEKNNFKINDNFIITNPIDIREKYVKPLVELRKYKGLTDDMARAYLEDNVVLGTMMLQLGEVDGLVSGAEHTTANTIRPALQLIKTAPDANLVSSVFFMCLPDNVLIYGDCAINPDPTAEELADIALQSARSAEKFGITPKVAMLSYSTGTSGSGVDVDKVREATRIVKEKAPDLLVDGPLQYDAAFSESVARSKAPNSPVAGKATVFIFPDLNTGNTTYKAVQRSANVLSIGPMLQGLNKPVNDLSRGASVDDIVFTIAITAIQG